MKCVFRWGVVSCLSLPEGHRDCPDQYVPEPVLKKVLKQKDQEFLRNRKFLAIFKEILWFLPGIKEQKIPWFLEEKDSAAKSYAPWLSRVGKARDGTNTRTSPNIDINTSSATFNSSWTYGTYLQSAGCCVPNGLQMLWTTWPRSRWGGEYPSLHYSGLPLTLAFSYALCSGMSFIGPARRDPKSTASPTMVLVTSEANFPTKFVDDSLDSLGTQGMP